MVVLGRIWFSRCAFLITVKRTPSYLVIAGIGGGGDRLFRAEQEIMMRVRGLRDGFIGLISWDFGQEYPELYVGSINRHSNPSPTNKSARLSFLGTIGDGVCVGGEVPALSENSDTVGDGFGTELGTQRRAAKNAQPSVTAPT